MVLLQTAKQAIGVLSSPPLHPPHPPGIGISLAEGPADILTAMSDAWTSCAVPATISAKASNTAIRRWIFSDIAYKIAANRAKS